MFKIQELTDLFSARDYDVKYALAKARGICIMCGNPADYFRDASAEIEYRISLLCQVCQDKYLAG